MSESEAPGQCARASEWSRGRHNQNVTAVIVRFALSTISTSLVGEWPSPAGLLVIGAVVALVGAMPQGVVPTRWLLLLRRRRLILGPSCQVRVVESVQATCIRNTMSESNSNTSL